jgi:hypothetical protein
LFQPPSVSPGRSPPAGASFSGSPPARYPSERSRAAYSLASFSDIASACTRRTATDPKRSRRAGFGRSANAAAIGRPVSRVSTGTSSSAATVGARSKTDADPRSFDGLTRAPHAAKTPSRRCQNAAVAGLSEERSQGRSAPHLKPWSELTMRVAPSSSARRIHWPITLSTSA